MPDIMDIEDIKYNIVTVLRNNLYPKQTLSPSSVNLIDTGTTYDIAQSFIPYSSTISSISIYMYRDGSIDNGCSISIQSSSNNLPSGTDIWTSTIPSATINTIGTTISTPVTLTSRLGTNTEYWLVLSPLNTTGTIKIYRDIVDTNYWFGSTYKREVGSTWDVQTYDIYFNCIESNWIFPDYPRDDLSMYSFPRIAVGIPSRPRVYERWIDKNIAEYHLIGRVTCYSRYMDELEDICSYSDKAMFENRTDITNIPILTPSGIGPIIREREYLFSRSMEYILQMRMHIT